MPSAPPALKTLQLGLRDVFTDPRGTRAAAAARPQTLSWVREGGACDPATRLSVYGDGYFLRMLEALAFDYPAARRAAGEEAFRALVAGYVAARPSTSPSLADLGEGFADFAAGHELGRRLPFLADLARLERAVSECLLVDRLPPPRAQELSALSDQEWRQARLVIDPSTRLLRARWPVLGLWRGASRRPSRPRAQNILVARHDGGIRAGLLPAPEWETLRRLQGGATLEEALANVNQPAGRIQRWFSSWTAAGLIKGARLG